MAKTLCKTGGKVHVKPDEARFICKKCDRVAKKEKDLCKPLKHNN
jgi:hypothetical protein